MPTTVHAQSTGNPFCVRDEWYFKDEQGREHGPYLSLGRATIGMGKYIRNELEQDAPKPLVWLAMLGVVALAGYFITHL